MRRILKIVLILTCIVIMTTTDSFITLALTPEGSRIGWDVTTTTVVYGNGQDDCSMSPKILKLKNGDLLCAFRYYKLTSKESTIRICKSTDKGKSWSYLSDVVPLNSDNYTTPHMIQLPDGQILCAFRQGFHDADRYLKVYKSDDNGQSWQYLSQIAGGVGLHYAEPVLLRKSTGEIMCFYATENYQPTYPQVIALKRSYNNGLTWGTEEIVSSSTASRDGTPAVTFINGNDNEILLVIEANDVPGYDFVIESVRSLDGGYTWGSRTLVYKPNRDPGNTAATKYRAAYPWIVQIPSTGELVVSFYTDEDKDVASEWTVDMKTIVSSDNGATWNRKSVPFVTNLDPGEERAMAKWDSLFILDSDTLMAVTSFLDGTIDYVVKTKTGDVYKSPMDAYYGTPVIDGGIAEDIWRSCSDQFAGTKYNNKSYYKVCYDDTYLYFYGHVYDTQFWSDSTDPSYDDAVAIMIDRNHDHAATPQTDDYKITISIGGMARYSKGNGTGWSSWTPTGITYAVALIGTANDNSDTDTRYKIEVRIPWSQIGGKPQAGSTFGVNFTYFDDDDGGDRECSETIPGNNSNKPSSWCDVTLK